eukprot:g59351.t1
MSGGLLSLLSLLSAWFHPPQTYRPSTPRVPLSTHGQASSLSPPSTHGQASSLSACHAALAPLGDLKLYIYDDPVIRMTSFLQEAEKLVEERKAAFTPDVELYNLFDAHPRRTLDPDLAYFFIIPIPVEFALVVDHALGQDGRHVPDVKRAFRTLLNHSVFQQTEGRHHFLPLHDWRFGSEEEHRGGQLKEFREQLRHITIGGMEHQKAHSLGWPQSVQERKITIPYGLVKQDTILKEDKLAKGNKLPTHSLTYSTFEEWLQRPYKLFYHTRRRPSAHGATILRMFFDSKQGGKDKPEWFFWNVSIGYPIEAELFDQRIKESQFCLVIRGDTPTSHAFSRALAANCIPIIISDPFDVAGMPFYPYLTVDSFTLSITEHEFRHDPWFELGRLLVAHAGDDPTASIYAKYEDMTNCARPALLYQHPQTLVPEYILLNMLDPKTDTWWGFL